MTGTTHPAALPSQSPNSPSSPHAFTPSGPLSSPRPAACKVSCMRPNGRLRVLLSRFSVSVSRHSLAVVLLCALSVAVSYADEAATEGRNLGRAIEMLEDGVAPADGLGVLAELILEDDDPGFGATVSGRLAVQVADLEMATDEGGWLLSFVATQVDGEPVVRHAVLEWPTGAGGRGWIWTTEVDLPEEFQDAAVVVEDLGSGRWGGTWVEFAGEASSRRPGFVVLTERTRTRSSSEREMVAEPAASAPATISSESPSIRLIPPAGRPIVGRARFRTVVTTDAIAKVVFYLDGEQVSVDDRPRFSAVIDVGREPTRHTIRAEAFGSGDLPLGEHELEINVDAQPFRVAIRELAEAGPDAVRVLVDLSVPPGERLSRLEFYRNVDLAATVTEAPFEAVIEAADGPGDFVRVLAVLVTGESLEDAQILAPGIISERVEVNLVEVYAVVTDRGGSPVTDLTSERFSLRQGRREIPIDRFALADEVPLVLGLIVDSSESMYPLMVETRMAAGQFFSSTLKAEDRGFLVDFDTQPRLAQGLTGDLNVLLRGLRELRPGGKTAIYDAAVFSLTQFESEPGRRALVLLTDGYDYGSRFSIKHCVQEARRLGVPIYVIVLNNLGILPESWRQDRPKKLPPVDAGLETLVLQTGGRLFNLAGTDELAGVYATINAELRSQYLLAFSTDERLEAKELQSLEVEVDGKGLEVRTVTLNR